jgi:hypothetical protein
LLLQSRSHRAKEWLPISITKDVGDPRRRNIHPKMWRTDSTSDQTSKSDLLVRSPQTARRTTTFQQGDYNLLPEKKNTERIQTLYGSIAEPVYLESSSSLLFSSLSPVPHTATSTHEKLRASLSHACMHLSRSSNWNQSVHSQFHAKFPLLLSLRPTHLPPQHANNLYYTRKLNTKEAKPRRTKERRNEQERKPCLPTRRKN